MGKKPAKAKKTSVKKAVAAKTVRRPTKKAAPKPLPASTGYWLMKSEPEAYSIDDFQRDKKTLWTGVRNYLARNFMTTAMVPGDRILFYHSSAEPTGVAGVGRIVQINVPDPTALDPNSDYYDAKASTDHPIWFCAEVEFEGRLKKMVELAAIRQEKALAKMPLLQTGQRLSIQPVAADEFKTILEMGEGIA
jgi:predicted RNA-binding protein with PUA-like domain